MSETGMSAPGQGESGRKVGNPGCAPNQLRETLWVFPKFLLYQFLLHRP